MTAVTAAFLVGMIVGAAMYALWYGKPKSVPNGTDDK
jgi:hypothetical protein